MRQVPRSALVALNFATLTMLLGALVRDAQGVATTIGGLAPLLGQAVAVIAGIALLAAFAAWVRQRAQRHGEAC